MDELRSRLDGSGQLPHARKRRGRCMLCMMTEEGGGFWRSGICFGPDVVEQEGIKDLEDDVHGS